MNKRAIVCIDDDRSILMSLRDQLTTLISQVDTTGKRYAIELAEGGEEGLALLDELVEDGIEVPLLICDEFMAGMRGSDLLALVDQTYPKILKILLTGAANLNDVAKVAKQLTLYRYIPKPWDQTDFGMTVREALRRYDQDHQLAEHNAQLLTVNQDLQRQIQERHQAEERLQMSEARLEGILNALEDVIWSASVEHLDLVYINPAAERIYQRPIQELMQTPRLWRELVVHPEDRGNVRHFLPTLMQQGNLKLQYRIVRPDGSVRWLSERGQVIYDEGGKPLRLDGIIHDFTDRQMAEAKLAHDALHDGLTGLPNRTLFAERVYQSIQQSWRDESYQFALLFIDLDRFKLVNDSLGHSIGDRLLVTIAQRLQKCVRQGDMVARLGGDEFTVLLSGIQSLEGATQIAERILLSCKKPLQLEGHTLFVDASIGIALGAPHYQTGEDLLRDADIAMYHAKVTGKARYALFDQEMHRRTLELLQLETELRQALTKKEFLLFYQPITILSTGALVGFEALLRWRHPERGLVPLATFIPVAEDTGLIVPIGEWVIQEACRQVQQWQQQFPGNNLMLSINLAGQQLKEPGLVPAIDAILKSTQITGHSLRLELTESMLIEDAEAIIHTLQELKDRNIQLSIDDFGTGYSSLSYLHRFPVSLLKIDRSFVSRMTTDSENFEIVRTICTLAHTLGMKVVAEGIETREQLTHLRNLGCEYGQGFLFSRPVAVEEATQMLATWDAISFQEQPA